MLEREIIQNRGFENVIEDGKVTGFRLLLRMPNYRGVYGRLIDGVDVRVDDLRWAARRPALDASWQAVHAPRAPGLAP